MPDLPDIESGKAGEHVYSIKQVSKMLDMPTVTIRAWENRYGAVKPLRTESRYRVYSSTDIEDLRWLKEQVEEKGISISQAVRMLKADRNALAAPNPEPVYHEADETYDRMGSQIYEALLAFQSEQANRLIDYGFSIYGYDAMFYKVLVPVLVRVGDAWEKGEATVVQEHFMTGLIIRRFYQFFHLFPVHSHLPKALAFCPEGEHHHVGLLLFSLLMRRNGLDVVYLGANTPVEGLLDMIGEQEINIVCISVTDPQLVSAAEELVRRVEMQYPEIRILLGGKGFETGATAYREYIMSEPTDKWQAWIHDLISREMIRSR